MVTKGTYLVDGLAYRGGKRLWTPGEDAVLRARYANEKSETLARVLRRPLTSVYQRARALELKKSEAYLASPDACRLRRFGPGIEHPGKQTQFPKGHPPANKGLRRPGWHRGRMRETQFKAGVPSWRLMPIGSTRLIDGYVYRKVSAVPRVPYTVNWKPEHVLVWTRANGPIPAGHAVAFKNGNREDIRLENLELLTRRALMARNSVHTLPKPLAQTVQLLGALHRQIGRKAARA